MNTRRLYRSRTDRALTGIAGGMAEYLDVDPTLVRILWVLAAIFTGGLAFLLYIVLAFVIPVNPYQGGPIPAGAAYATGPTGWGTPGAATSAGQPGTAYATGTGYATGYAGQPAGSAVPGGVPAWGAGWNAEYERSRAARAERPGRAGLIIGTVLIVFGAIALADIVLPGWISGALVVPGLFVALGAGLVVASLRGRGDERAAAASAGSYAAPPAPSAPFQATEPVVPAAESIVPSAASDVASAEAGAPVEAVPAAAGYEDDATTSLPPLPGSDGA